MFAFTQAEEVRTVVCDAPEVQKAFLSGCLCRSGMEGGMVLFGARSDFAAYLLCVDLAFIYPLGVLDSHRLFWDHPRHCILSSTGTNRPVSVIHRRNYFIKRSRSENALHAHFDRGRPFAINSPCGQGLGRRRWLLQDPPKELDNPAVSGRRGR